MLSDPATAQDYEKFRDLSKQRKAMEETVKNTAAIIEDKATVFFSFSIKN
jgi:hypothetical protein